MGATSARVNRCRGWRRMISAMSRDALWPEPAEPCEAVPAVPQDAWRHLHKVAPVPCFITCESMWDRRALQFCSFQSFALFCLSLFGQSRLTLWSVCLQSWNDLFYPSALKESECGGGGCPGAALLSPGPRGGWPEVSVWCAAVRQRGGGEGGAGRYGERKKCWLRWNDHPCDVTPQCQLAALCLCQSPTNRWTFTSTQIAWEPDTSVTCDETKQDCVFNKIKEILNDLNQSRVLHWFDWRMYSCLSTISFILV